MNVTVINESVYEIHKDGSKTLIAGDPEKNPQYIAGEVKMKKYDVYLTILSCATVEAETEDKALDLVLDLGEYKLDMFEELTSDLSVEESEDE